MEDTSKNLLGYIDKLYEKTLDQAEYTSENADILEENVANIISLSEIEMKNKADIEDALTYTDTTFNKLSNAAGSINKVIDKSKELENGENLKVKGKEIEDIAILVSSLAYQTNLLALNASIEASRAGEYGQGFFSSS